MMDDLLHALTARAGLYDLRPGSSVSRELDAYRAGFFLLEPHLRALEGGAWARTMNPAQLAAACRVCGLPAPAALSGGVRARANADIEELRGCVETLLRGCGGHTLARMQTYLRRLGAQVTLNEQADVRRVTVTGEQLGGLVPDLETLRRLLGAVLPAGAESALDFGRLTWEMLDTRDFSAAALDEKNFTWAWFDLYGQLLLGEG